MTRLVLRCLWSAAAGATLLVAPVHAQPSTLQPAWGISASGAVAGAPVGQLASRAGTAAVSGAEYGIRVVRRSSAGAEWSVGVVSDSYSVDQESGIDQHFLFDYASTALVAGRTQREEQAGVPVSFSVDVGWRWFEASSTVPSYYTGDTESSRARGSAALLAASLGVDVPLRSALLVPRVRVETNYPDIGGGDGYSGLHRSWRLGFRASVGADFKWTLGR